MSRCRKCRRPIFWAHTEATETKAGKPIPLDADPSGRRARFVANGNIRFTGQRTGDGTMIVRQVAAGAGPHVAHFATCPKRKRAGQ